MGYFAYKVGRKLVLLSTSSNKKPRMMMARIEKIKTHVLKQRGIVNNARLP